jgi:hypothetical protein
LPLASEGRAQDDAPRRAGVEAGARTTKEEGDQVTTDWCIRRCDSCGILEADLRAVLVVDSGGDVVHLRDGLFRCGVMAEVDDESVAQ